NRYKWSLLIAGKIAILQNTVCNIAIIALDAITLCIDRNSAYVRSSYNFCYLILIIGNPRLDREGEISTDILIIVQGDFPSFVAYLSRIQRSRTYGSGRSYRRL